MSFLVDFGDYHVLIGYFVDRVFRNLNQRPDSLIRGE